MKHFVFKIINRSKKILFSIVKIPLHFIHINPKKIVFINYHGKGYGDNLKYIANELINDKNIDICWLLKADLINKVPIPPHVRIAKYDSLEGLYEMATAKVWISNCRKVFCPIKKKNQYYIQTWHGGIALKKVEGDANDLINRYYMKCARRDTKYANLMISNSKTCTDMYRRAFWYNGEILECGSPRNDILINYNDEKRDGIRHILKIEPDEVVLLYAPTFRENNNMTPYIDDFGGIQNALSKITSVEIGKIKILLRLHPNISHLKHKYKCESNIIDVTDYDDMQELMLASDYLITDYSSTSFEFSLMKKPVFLYMKDYDLYCAQRGLFFKNEELPYPIAYTYSELENVIRSFSPEQYNDALSKFFEEQGLFETGEASRQVANRIRSVMEENIT